MPTSLIGLDKLPKTSCLCLAEGAFGNVGPQPAPLKSVNLRCKEGLTDLHLATPTALPEEHKYNSNFLSE